LIFDVLLHKAVPQFIGCRHESASFVASKNKLIQTVELLHGIANSWVRPVKG